MALPTTLRKNDPISASDYGIAVAITPFDKTAGIEIQRAPDSSGSPNVGAAVTVDQLPPITEAGATWIDHLQNDGVRFHYRWRHVAAGYDPGDWSPWARDKNGVLGGVPVLLDGRAAILATIYPLSRGAGLAGQTRNLLALASTPELLPNGEFDLWETDAQPHAWSVDTGDSSSASRATAAGEVLSGEAAAKFSFGGGGSAGTYRGFTTNDLVKGAFNLPLRAGRTYRILVGSRVSSIAGGGESYRLTLTFNVGATLTATKTFVYAAATTYQIDEWQVSVPAAAEPYSKLAVEFTRSNTTAHDFWLDSLRVLEDAPSAAQIAAQMAQAGGDFVLNGLFEDGVAYWRGTVNPNLDSTTTSVIEGVKSLLINSGAPNTRRVQQCDRATDLSGGQNPTGGNPLYVPVSALDEIWGSVKFKAGTADSLGAYKFGIEEYDATKTLVQRTYLDSKASLTTVQTLKGGAVVQATTAYVVAIIEMVPNAGAGGIDLRWDEFHLYRNPARRRCRTYRSAAKSVATATETVLDWDTETAGEDVGTWHDTVTNNSRLTVPAEVYGRGWIRIMAQIQWAANATGYRRVRIKKNGTTFIADDIRAAAPTIETAQQVAVDDMTYVPGDFYEVFVTQSSGGNLNANNGHDVSFAHIEHIF